MSDIEEELAFQLRAVGIACIREYIFSPLRNWRADFYIQPQILVEVEGIIYRPRDAGDKSRHTTPKGYQNDCEKYNHAQLLGYMVLRFTQKQVKSGEALNTIEKAIEAKRERMVK